MGHKEGEVRRLAASLNSPIRRAVVLAGDAAGGDVEVVVTRRVLRPPYEILRREEARALRPALRLVLDADDVLGHVDPHLVFLVPAVTELKLVAEADGTSRVVEAVHELSATDCKSPHLVTLDLSDAGFRGAQDAAKIGAALTRPLSVFAAMRRLDLARNALGDAGAEALAAAVRLGHPALGLEAIDVSANGIGARGGAALVGALASACSARLRSVALADNALRAEAGVDLRRELARLLTLPALEIADLARNPLQELGALALADALGSAATPGAAFARRRIDLSDALMGPEGAENIAAAMRAAPDCGVAPAVADLNLAGNAFGPGGTVAVVAAALAGDAALTALASLDVSRNSLGGGMAALSLAQTLGATRGTAPRALRRLGLRGNFLGDMAATRMMEALASDGCALARGLTHVDLGRNGLTSLGIISMVKPLTSGGLPALEMLDVSDNPLCGGCDSDSVRAMLFAMVSALKELRKMNPRLRLGLRKMNPRLHLGPRNMNRPLAPAGEDNRD